LTVFGYRLTIFAKQTLALARCSDVLPVNTSGLIEGSRKVKAIILGVTLVCLAGSASAACPWASKHFKATVQPSLNFEFKFDDTCATVVAQKSGKKAETVQTTVIDRSNADQGWYFEYDLFEFLFRANGERADARQGGTRRQMRLIEIEP
jgi:hypothetical protein